MNAPISCHAGAKGLEVDRLGTTLTGNAFLRCSAHLTYSWIGGRVTSPFAFV
jgi:hypothetical protein